MKERREEDRLNNKTAPVTIWLVMTVLAVVEVLLMRTNPGNLNIDIVIGLLAAFGGILTALFSMGLREENTAIKYLFLIPVLLVAVLIITLVLSFPIIQ
jgi:multidrug transporter EmrE-like cation transporter